MFRRGKGRFIGQDAEKGQGTGSSGKHEGRFVFLFAVSRALSVADTDGQARLYFLCAVSPPVSLSKVRAACPVSVPQGTSTPARVEAGHVQFWAVLPDDEILRPRFPSFMRRQVHTAAWEPLGRQGFLCWV